MTDNTLRQRYSTNHTVIEVGVDEVGRGCLGGRVYAAAVVWPHIYVPESEKWVKDSKRLSEKKRNYAEVIAVLHEMLTPFENTYEIRDAAIHVPVTYDRIHLDYTLTKLSKEEVTEQLEERLSSISTTLKITNYPKPINEIVYIKYDTINMKYVYICSNCQFSWRNDE